MQNITRLLQRRKNDGGGRPDPSGPTANHRRDWRIPRRDTNDGEPQGDNGSRATAGPTTLTDKDDDGNNGSNGDKQ